MHLGLKKLKGNYMNHSTQNDNIYDVNSCLRIKALLRLEGKALLLNDVLTRSHFINP